MGRAASDTDRLGSRRSPARRSVAARVPHAARKGR